MQVPPVNSTPPPARTARHDLAALKRGNLDPAEQRTAVATQFEAILLRQFLQDSVGKIMGGESAGPSGNIYGYMLTDVLASKISEGGGLGLASVIQRQLSPRPAATAGAQKPTP